MLTLRERQRGFLRALEQAPGEYAPPGALHDAGGFDVYRNNYLEGTRKALAADYPVVARLVGTDCFRGLAIAYRASSPSRSGDLHAFGHTFPGFLAQCYADSAYAFLADVAALERAIVECLCEPASPALPIGALRDPAFARVGEIFIQLQPSARFLQSRWPVLPIWQANQEDRDGSGVTLDSGGMCVLALRMGERVTLRPLSEELHAFATQLAAHGSLTRAIGATGHAEAAGSLLAQLFDAGLVSRVECSEPEK